MKNRNIYLVRHGQTDWNAEKRWHGQEGPGLNENGILNAKESAGNLVGKKISCVISSDLTRARETDEIISDKLNVPLHFSEFLRERNIGGLPGLTVTEIMGKHPQIKLPEYDFGIDLEGLEKWGSYSERVIKGFHEILDANDGNIVIVTHGGVIQVIKQHLGVSKIYPIVPNGSTLQIVETSNGVKILQS